MCGISRKSTFHYVNSPTMRLLILLQVFRHLSVVHNVIWGEQHRKVTMPCSFTPEGDAVIYWHITSDKSRVVHSYYEGKDQLERQDKIYKGRTSLFLNEIAKGNASLQLSDLQGGDENTYTCYVGTKTSKEDILKLKVADFGHTIEYELAHDEVHLKCFASQVYPPDKITIEWDEGNLGKQLDHSASSACTFCDLKTNSYKCVVRHSVVQDTWIGEWQPKALEQNNVECACSFCKTINSEMSVRFYLKQNATKVPLASMNSSSAVISEGYTSRVHAKLEEYSLLLNNVTANDNGDYICEIRTSDRMIIAITSVNITDPIVKNQRTHWFLAVIFVLVFVLFCFTFHRTFNNPPPSGSNGELPLSHIVPNT